MRRNKQRCRLDQDQDLLTTLIGSLQENSLYFTQELAGPLVAEVN
jgi:hypothetical protein